MKREKRNATATPPEQLRFSAAAETVLIGAADALASIHGNDERSLHVHATLAAVGLQLSGAMSVDRIGEVVHHAVSELWNWDSFFLATRQAGHGRFKFVRILDTINGVKQMLPPATLKTEDKPCYDAILDGRPVLINRPSQGRTHSLNLLSPQGERSASILFAPVRIVDEAVAIISVQSFATHAFNEEDRDLLQRLADLVGPALLRCQAEKRSSVFAALGQSLSRARTPIETANVIVDAADELVGWDSCGLRLYEAGTNTMCTVLLVDIVAGEKVVVSRHGERRSTLAEDRAHLLERAELVLREEEEAEYPHDLIAFGDKTRRSLSLMFVPIRSSSGPLGFITVQSYTARAYNQHDLETMQVLADHCSGAIERTRAEAALQESEHRFRTVVEALGEGLVITDSRDRIVYVNARMCELTGYNEDEIMGRSFRRLMFLFPDKQQVVTPGVAGVHTYAARMQGSNGSLWWAEIHETPYRPAGAETGFLRAISDVTERKQSETELEAFSQLGLELSAADTYGKLGQVVRKITEQLWAWDAFFLLVKRADEDYFRTIIEIDTLDGNRTPVPLTEHNAGQYYGMTELMQGRPVLTNRTAENKGPDLPRFGDVSRLSASMIHAPVRVAGAVVGILSIQSYTPMRYSERDARVVLRVADAIGPTVERCRDREAMRTSEEKYRQLVENVNDGIMISQRDRIVYFNRRLSEMLGYDAEELQHANFRRLYSRASLQLLDERASRRLKGEDVPSRYEITMVRKGGEPIMVEASVSIIAYQGEAATFAVVRDVTDRVKSEAQLARLGAAVEQSTDAIIIMGTDWRVEYVNHAFEIVTGYTFADAKGQTVRHLLDSGQHEDEFYAKVEETLTKGNPWSGRFINRRRDGTMYEEDAIISPLRDATGTVTNYISVQRDVTEKLALERQLRHSQKMEAVGQLAGGIAHDFNNLLVAIMGYSELLLGNMAEEESMRDDVREIQRAADRAATLTKKLLQFSRRQAIQPTLVNINETVINLEKMLKMLLGERIELIIEVDRDIAGTLTDLGQVEQIIVNLALNARDAMPEGGRLTIETQNTHLADCYTTGQLGVPPGWYVVLTISDTGCGMTAGVQSRIFEPFFTTKELGRGTGLGLATVYGIVKQSNGAVSVRSEEGKGSSFRIYLPAVEDKENAAIRTTRPTILLVENEPAIRSLAERVLENSGFHVTKVASAKEALRVSEELNQQFDLLLTDFMMSDMNGADLAQELVRRRSISRVLYMSDHAENLLRSTTPEITELTFVKKPFKAEELVESVRKSLQLEIS